MATQLIGAPDGRASNQARALTIVTPNYTREGGGSRIALFPDHRAFVPCTRACPGSGWRGVPAELVKGQHKPCHSEFPTFYPLLQLEMCCGYKTGCIQCDYSVSSIDRAPRWLSRCVVSAPVSMCVSLFLCHSVCDRCLHGYYFTFSSTDQPHFIQNLVVVDSSSKHFPITKIYTLYCINYYSSKFLMQSSISTWKMSLIIFM